MRTTVVTLIALFGFACSSTPQVIQPVRVVVLSPEFRVLRTLDGNTELAEFALLWGARDRVDLGPLELSAYDVAIDIEANQGSGRWFYRTDGVTTLLSAKSGNVYRVEDPSSLNALLQLDHEVRQGDQP